MEIPPYKEFENLVNQECRKTPTKCRWWQSAFENHVNQECRKTYCRCTKLNNGFENLVNQECRKIIAGHGRMMAAFESLVNQEYRTLNKYICNQMHGKTYKPTKTKIWRVLSNPTKGVYKRERPPCNEPILSRKTLKVNTTL